MINANHTQWRNMPMRAYYNPLSLKYLTIGADKKKLLFKKFFAFFVTIRSMLR